MPALLIDQFTIGDISFWVVDSDPSLGVSGFSPKIGDIFLIDDPAEVQSGIYVKTSSSINLLVDLISLQDASTYAYQTITSNNFTFGLSANQTDYFIGANNTFASNLIITLPVITQKAKVTIKDQSFTSGSYKITVLPSGTNTIDNTTSFIIKSKGASVTFYNDEIGKWFSS